MPLTRPVGAEPLLVIFQFTHAAYSDVTGNEIVVTIRRTDQDRATANALCSRLKSTRNSSV